MKYMLAYLIKGKAKGYHESLLYDIAKKFKISGAVERKPPSHLTLKYRFETDSREKIEEIERLIAKFCKSNHKTLLKLQGFGSFDKEVIFIDAIPSKEMRKVHSSFMEALRKIPWMTWEPFDGENIHFHASLAHSDVSEENFDEIWKYVNKDKPSFDLYFDNITVLKLEDGIWKVHKQFKIN